MPRQPKKLFSCILPDGRVETRKSSEDCRYAVAIKLSSPILEGWGILALRREKRAADRLAASVEDWPEDRYKPLEVAVLPVKKVRVRNGKN